MVTRRYAREWALQMLAQFDLNTPENLDEEIKMAWVLLAAAEEEALENPAARVKKVFTSMDSQVKESLEKMKEFTEVRVRGVMAQREALDAEIKPLLKNWEMRRLGLVVRNVLRMGVWEMLNCKDIAVAVVINEAVDIARYFSESSGARLVNGVLDTFSKNLANQEFTP